MHRRSLELAKHEDRSLTSVVADLTLRGLPQLDTPIAL